MSPQCSLWQHWASVPAIHFQRWPMPQPWIGSWPSAMPLSSQRSLNLPPWTTSPSAAGLGMGIVWWMIRYTKSLKQLRRITAAWIAFSKHMAIQVYSLELWELISNNEDVNLMLFRPSSQRWHVAHDQTLMDLLLFYVFLCTDTQHGQLSYTTGTLKLQIDKNTPVFALRRHQCEKGLIIQKPFTMLLLFHFF